MPPPQALASKQVAPLAMKNSLHLPKLKSGADRHHIAQFTKNGDQHGGHLDPMGCHQTHLVPTSLTVPTHEHPSLAMKPNYMKLLSDKYGEEELPDGRLISESAEGKLADGFEEGDDGEESGPPSPDTANSGAKTR